MNRNTLCELVKLAGCLDKKDLIKEANLVDKIMFASIYPRWPSGKEDMDKTLIKAEKFIEWMESQGDKFYLPLDPTDKSSGFYTRRTQRYPKKELQDLINALNREEEKSLKDLLVIYARKYPEALELPDPPQRDPNEPSYEANYYAEQMEKRKPGSYDIAVRKQFEKK